MGAKIKDVVWGQNLHECIVMFEFNYSVGDIKNSDLGEGIVCLGDGSRGKGEGSGGKGVGRGGKRGGKRGKGGREVGNAYPPCPSPQRK